MQIFARRELASLPPGVIENAGCLIATEDGLLGRPAFNRRPGRPSSSSQPVAQRAIDKSRTTDRPALLLEGSWPDEERRHDRWSLDDAVDSRFAWIDRWAAEHAERLAQRYPGAGNDDQPMLAYLNELALRYFLVKLLRVVAFFDEVCRPTRGERWHLHLADESDAVYAELFGALAERHGVELAVHCHGSPGPCGWPGSVAFRSAKRRPFAERKATLSWRRWAAHAARIFSRDPSATDDHHPPVVLCGNPMILDPVCGELLARGCRVWWLYEEFAVRAWWKWRAAGVEQLLCDDPTSSDPGQRWDSLRSAHPTSVADAAPPLAERHGVRCLQMVGVSGVICRGVRLDEAIASWLSEQAAKHGARQSWWLERIDKHLRAVRPTVLVLDEDATAFKRAAVAMARRHGARSLVVQHGAPCGPFGFAPLAADEICVWGESTREQLIDWGVADSRIHVTGWPSNSPCRERTSCRSIRHVDQPPSAGSPTPTSSAKDSRGRLSHTPVAQLPVLSVKANQMPISPRFLLLATVPPDDRRPDTVDFHLTTRNHAAMIDLACAAVSRFAGARLTVKLHPRAKDARLFEKLARRWRQLDIRLVQRGDTASLWSDADCVLSCASTAGIEAALAGAPVVQLLPEGSGDVLPADRWRLIGSARTLEELCPLINQALARGWCKATDQPQEIAALTGPRAAAAIVARVLLSVSTPVAGAEACRCPGVEPPGHRRGSAPATAVLDAAALRASC